MPVWFQTVKLKDIWREDVPFPIKRDKVVNRFREHSWGQLSYVSLLLDELEATENVGEFDYVLDGLYDVADRDRVWLETF